MSPSRHTALYASATWIWLIKCHCDRLELCPPHDAVQFLQGSRQTKATLNSLKHDVFICGRDSIIRFSVKATNNNNHNNNNSNNKSHKSKKSNRSFPITSSN
uniref:Uncharacterized protein n=1 Tax=Glossina pallidipes TaxID=7398 RepID=A0A1A9ZTJ7_GLOPL